MSIVVLKKKTGAQYNNNSVSQPLFSLNGTHRSQGFVGQTTLSRSLPRTLIRNGGYRNYGGCCGAFPIGQIVQSSVKTTEDITIVKSSVLNMPGLMHVGKYRWIWRPQPETTVKIDSNQNINTQSMYISILQRKTLKEANACNKINTNPNSQQQCNTNCNLTKPRYTPFKNPGNWSKPNSDFVAMSQGEYLLKLDDSCAEIDIKKLAQNVQPCNSCALPGNR